MSTETPVRITICGGTVAQIRTPGQCYGLCAKPDARRIVSFDASPYYDPIVACECGDSWSTEGLMARPFRRAWRKAAQARFEADWERAAPEGSQVTRDDEFYVTGVETDEMSKREGDLRPEAVNNIRPDLSKRTPDEVKAAERLAKNAAAADSAVRSGGDEEDRKGLFGTIFGSKK